MLDLESVRCFVTAAARPTFRSAARAVALSPPAFGDRIKRLEEAAGGLLFRRGSRTVELTALGAAFLPRARRLLAEAETALPRGIDPSEAQPFELTLGTRFELGLSWIVPALGVLERKKPERRIQLTFGDSPELLAKVREGKADAAVTSTRVLPAGTRYAVLHEERYVFVASGRVLARAGLRSADDARGHTLLDVDADLPLFRYFLDAVPRGEAWVFGRVVSLGTIAAIRARVLEGAGVAVLPLYFVEADLRRRRLTRLFPRLPLKRDAFRLVWREDHPRDGELKALAEELRRLPLR